MKKASLDFETRSRVKLADAGMRRYMEDPSTSILCMGYMIWGQRPEIWIPGNPFPKELLDVDMFYAWNAQFEIEVFRVLGAQLGWPSIPADKWHDSMGDAARSSFPLDLDGCAKALRVPHQKDPKGKRLINKLCKPANKGDFYEFSDCPDDFIALYDYCKKDCLAEKATHDELPEHVSGEEDLIQRATWESNSRGVPIDISSVEIIKGHLDRYTELLDFRVQKITGGILDSARQRDKLLMHLEMNREAADKHLIERDFQKNILGQKVERLSVKKIPGIKLKNMQSETVEKVLKEWELSEYDRELLEIRVAINHASVAKYKKILLQICQDNTVKDNIQYHGAGPGRDAARGFQLQNLPRDTEKEPEKLLEFFDTWTTDELELVFDILKKASTLIRPMIKAPHQKKLIVSDYGQIEARGTSWTAKEEDILQNFRNSIDPYVAQASDMYNVILEAVTPTQRQYGKLAILACGYQGAHKALTDFAETYYLELSRADAVEIVKAFRASRPLLVQAWYSFGEASVLATNDAGAPYQVSGCQHAVFQMQGEHLTLELPSGRKIWYPYAKVENVEVKYQDAKTGKTKTFRTNAVTCWWVSSYTSRWEKRAMSGGKFFQNYVQAIARDLLMSAILRLEDRGYEVVARVHDEAVVLAEDSPKYNIEEMNRIMCELPEWAQDFPVEAAGYESYRYRK